MKMNVAVIPGDGVGPEITAQAMRVLQKTAEVFGHEIAFQRCLMGGAAIDAVGVPLPDETLAICKRADAVLLGAVGGPKWDGVDAALRPERGLLALRKELGLFANLRPAKLFSALKGESPVKESILGDGFDILVVRELTGDVYFGEKKRCQTDGGITGSDAMSYSEAEVERIGRTGFALAMQRKKKITSVDKANVLETSKVWRETMHRLRAAYPEVAYEDMYVDNCAMQLVRNPGQFDVIVTGNLFGDILSDEASAIAGSIGLLPSASLGSGTFGLYEPIHGSAPDIAGKSIANPIGTILSVAMMLRHSFALEAEAKAIEEAVEAVLNRGMRTADLTLAGGAALQTEKMGDAICAAVATG